VPKIVVFHGDTIEREIPLTGRTLRIGRDAQNDIVLSDSSSGVSRFHAEIQPSAGGTYTIVDKNSRNGLWIKKHRVPSAVLELGMPVNVGAYEILLEDDVEAAQDEEEGLTMAPTIITSGKRASPPRPVAAHTPPDAPADRTAAGSAGTGAMPRPSPYDRTLTPSTAGMPVATDTVEKTGSMARTGAMAVAGTVSGTAGFAKSGTLPTTAAMPSVAVPSPTPIARTPAAKAGPPAAKKSAGNTLPLALGGAAALVIVIGGAVWFLRKPAPAPQPPLQQVVQTPPPVETTPPKPADPPPPSTADLVARHLADAKDLMAKADMEGARREVAAILALDAQNQDAVDLSKKIDAAVKKPVKTTPAKPVETLALVPGIPPFDKEAPRDYNVRSARILANYTKAKQELDQKQYIKAMETFRLVEADLPNYGDVRDLYAQAENSRTAAFKQAIDSGAANESQGRLNAAYRWYKSAEQYDTGSSAADRLKGVLAKIQKEVDALFERAQVFDGLKKTSDAAKAYQQIADLLDMVPEGQQNRERALDKLKASR